MRIVFMGTPMFAVPALEALLKDGNHQVIAVYTKAPQPAGRGQKETLSPIHQLASQYNIPVYTPRSLRPLEEAAILSSLKPDAIVVAAYGLILPQQILDIPHYACVNIHPSTLPRWRGAAPLQWTILSGDSTTSMCIMRMDAGMDTGDIILQQNISLDDKVTIKGLHDMMAQLGATLLLQALTKIDNGSATYTPQSKIGITHAPKLTKEHEVLNFTQPIRLVHAQIRAFSPQPGAYFEYNNERVKIISAEYNSHSNLDAVPGTVLDEHLSIVCQGGVLHPTLLQRQGRKMLYTDAFLRGFPIPKAIILGHQTVQENQ